jgi:hypothetical protein
VIEEVVFSSSEKMSSKIKEFIEKSKASKLVLNRLGLRSKDFCVICLGIGTKATFDYLSLRDNHIGELAIKCLDVLMKFHKTCQFDFTGNPLERELKGRTTYKRCLIPRIIE